MEARAMMILNEESRNGNVGNSMVLRKNKWQKRVNRNGSDRTSQQHG
jgi:hypothetical protein